MGAPGRTLVGLVRITVGLVTVAVLLVTYVKGIPLDGANPFNYFGYFTNLTSLLTAILFLAAGARTLAAAGQPSWFTEARAVAVACMIVVAVIYNTLIPGTGSAAAWVSALLHAIFPAAVLLDWILIGDRAPLPWRRLWIVLPIPLLWLAVVLLRGATDGWVPYGFLLPSHGLVSLLAHVGLLLTALLAAGACVWALSRTPGVSRALAIPRGYEVARLRGCEVARLRGCEVARLRGCDPATPQPRDLETPQPRDPRQHADESKCVRSR